MAVTRSAPTTPATITIPPNVGQPFTATSSDPFMNAVAPVQGTDVTVNNGSIVGVNLKSFSDPTASVLIGPNLTHFGSRDLIAGGVLSWDRASCVMTTDAQGNAAPERLRALVEQVDRIAEIPNSLRAGTPVRLSGTRVAQQPPAAS